MLYPCGHRVLVKVKDVEKERDLGNGKKLALAYQDERVQEAAQIEGRVVRVGPQAWLAFREIDDSGKWVNGRPWAKEGDRVYFAKYSGHTIHDPETDEKYTLLNDEDITCIIVTKE